MAHGLVDEAGILRIDNTILRALATCDTQAVIRHILGLTSLEESRFFASGRAGHAARAEWHTSQGDVTKAMLVFDAEYQEWATANVPNDDRLSWANVRRCTERWLRAKTPQQFPLEPITVEQTLETPLTDDGTILFVMKMDLFGQDQSDGSHWVCDVKTTGRMTPDWKRQFRNDSQLSGYCWGAEQVYGVPITGAYIDGVEYAKLPSASNRKCKEHDVMYSECSDLHATSEVFAVTRTPDQLRQWKQQAIALATRYRAMLTAFSDPANIQKAIQQGTFTGACSYCFAQDWCGLGRPPEALQTIFIESRWEPTEV